MHVNLPRSLSRPLQLPVYIRMVTDDREPHRAPDVPLPKIIAGGVPVIAFNIALRDRHRNRGATRASLRTRAHAASLYVEFCAQRECGLLNVSDNEFSIFQQALIGHSFRNARGDVVWLEGRRSRRTADLILALLYSLTGDIEEQYGVVFSWRRYTNTPQHGLAGLPIASIRAPGIRRAHSFNWESDKVLGLPDPQFVQLLLAARDRWGDIIADGDRAFAADPEEQRGALMYRNVALLLLLRFAGSRRSEVGTLRYADLNRENHLIYLETKGHSRGLVTRRSNGRLIEHRRRLPVLLLPLLEAAIWQYVTCFRPVIVAERPEDADYIFLSHSANTYGQPLGAQGVYTVITTLRTHLPAPWNVTLAPHMLRHAFGYMLQKLGGQAAVVANMRHKSFRSSEPYAAGAEHFADEFLMPMNMGLEHLLTQAGLLEALT